MDDMAASTGAPSSSFSFIFFFFLFFSFLLISTAEDTITPTKFITDGQTLISPGKIFELGFFSLNNSSSHFLGIWYHNIPVRTYVWVANGDRPLSDSSGVFTIQEDRGGLILLDGKQALVWSTNASVTTKNSTSAKLLDSGNLVLITAGNFNSSEGILWQSFDHPSNTLLPGMKIGFNRSTQQNSLLVSWKTDTDPSPGSFSYGLDPQDSYQFFIWKNSVPYWRSGYWNGRAFNLIPEASTDFVFHFNIKSSEEEVSFEYSALYDNTRLVMDVSGQLTCLVWYDATQVWGPVWSAPKDQCSYYGVCGFNSICSDYKMPKCKCLPGFEPDSPKDWNSGNWVNGCKRRKRLECVEKDEFLALGRLKVPDGETAVEAESAEVCRDGCRKSCSCIAYAYANDSNNGGSGCLVWYGNLTDVGDLKVTYGSQDLFIRSAGLESGQGKKKLVPIIVSTTVCTAILIVGIVLYCSWRRKVKKEGNTGRILNTLSFNSSDSAPILKGALVADNLRKDGNESIDIPFFSFRSVLAATDHFSDSNLLGEGGFGRVYKGKLLGGQEIAVKRLSSTSGQGQEEFKNEVMLIAKLQHRNLVRILGYCIETDERMLLYEYMPNKSLDFFIFDPNQSKLLNWEGRFNIILGIARGLLYLHQDSRLRIIHRDLKTSNILLDEEMNPKISDFGMARIFKGNETQGNTKRIVGTYGYMSPEYALDGLFSAKSDVFSFGVIVLEIISGKRNNGFYHYEDSLSLLVYAWKLWTEDKALELIDSSLGELTDERDVLKCFQIGLLCVQENPADRPTMASVVADLGSENAALPMPIQPASYVRKHLMEEQLSRNEVTVTQFEGR